MDVETEYICVGCCQVFKYEDGRFAYPTGDRCTKCGDFINDYLKEAERAIKMYNQLSGYKGVKIDHGY